MTTCDDAKIQDKDGNAWLYSDIVREHFFKPHNMLLNSQDFDLTDYHEGRVGSPACGDEMVIWIKVDKETKKILDCKWQTFGCGSAIASTSILSDMVLENGGITLDEAMKIKPQDITDRLGGLPPRKIHCSVLGDQALQLAIKNYEKGN
jgi:NifU-like protein involved in Fe-S cluster formation